MLVEFMFSQGLEHFLLYCRWCDIY